MEIFDQIIDRRYTQSVKWSGFPAENTIPMCVADMDFQAPQPIVDALLQRVSHGVFGYTKDPDNLNDVISAWTVRRYQWAIQSDSISMNRGVVTSLCTAIRALTKEGDRIIIQPPVYHPFFTAIRNNRRIMLENPLILEHGRYVMDFEGLEQLATEAKVLMLCNPHNPVGRQWTAEELQRLGEICLRHGVLIISDDIHADFTWEQRYCPFASLHPDFAQQSVTCLSPSKTFNIAGLKTSYEIIPNSDLRQKIQCEKVRSGGSHPNLFGLLALEQAYTACDGWLDHLLHYLKESQALIRESLQGISSVKFIEPEGTYLAWLDCRKLGCPSQKLVDYLLETAHVRLVAGRVFGSTGEGFLRLNYGTDHASLKKGLPRIVDALSSLDGR